MKWILFLIPAFVFAGLKANSQVLFTEDYTVILDTAKRISGEIIPDFEFKTQKKNLIEFENNADISFIIKKHVFTFANKIEFSKLGEEVFLSGGYIYGEYQRILRGKIELEPYSQIEWAGARGLEIKYAGGINLRWKIVSKNYLGFFAGSGPFYEYEKWNYEGVSDSTLIPEDTTPIIIKNIKLGSYLSLKFMPNSQLLFDISIYHQSRFDEIISSPRLASSSGVTYNINENIGITFKYQNIYDYDPPVPIDKLYNKVVSALSVAF